MTFGGFWVFSISSLICYNFIFPSSKRLITSSTWVWLNFEESPSENDSGFLLFFGSDVLISCRTNQSMHSVYIHMSTFWLSHYAWSGKRSWSASPSLMGSSGIMSLRSTDLIWLKSVYQAGSSSFARTCSRLRSIHVRQIILTKSPSSLATRYSLYTSLNIWPK